LLLRLVFDMHETDVKSGFCVYKREVFADILQHAPRYRYFQTFVTVAAKAKGYSVRQIETLFLPRKAGTSFISRLPFGVMARTMVDIGRAVGEFRVRRPKEQALALALAGRAMRPRPPEEPLRRRYYRAYCALMPVHHWAISRNAPRYLDELRQTQWLPPSEIEALQLRRLQRLVRHASQHVADWREAPPGARLVPDDLPPPPGPPRPPPLTHPPP